MTVMFTADEHKELQPYRASLVTVNIRNIHLEVYCCKGYQH